MRAAALGFVCGVAVGGALVAALLGPDEAAAPPAPPDVAPPVVASPVVASPVAGPEAPPAAAPPADPDCAQSLARAELELRIARARLVTHEGEPQPWPTDLPERATPEGFERALRAELPNHDDVVLMSIDCGEYPCVALLGMPDAESMDEMLTLAMGGALDRALSAGTDLVPLNSLSYSDTNGGAFTLALVPAGRFDEAANERLAWRAGQALAEANRTD